MHTPVPSTFPANSNSPVEQVLRLARRLHRAAVSDSLSMALPVLRRLLATGVVRGPLTALFRSRATVQRKHVLRMLAREGGFPGWEAFRSALLGMVPSDLDRIRLAQEGSAVLHLWFATEAQACVHAAHNGGRVVRIGTQAVVMPN